LNDIVCVQDRSFDIIDIGQVDYICRAVAMTDADDYSIGRVDFAVARDESQDEVGRRQADNLGGSPPRLAFGPGRCCG